VDRRAGVLGVARVEALHGEHVAAVDAERDARAPLGVAVLDAIPKRGSTDHRSGTDPDRPSTRRTTWFHSSGRAIGRISASVTRAVPLAVSNVVSSTFVSGR